MHQSIYILLSCCPKDIDDILRSTIVTNYISEVKKVQIMSFEKKEYQLIYGIFFLCCLVIM